MTESELRVESENPPKTCLVNRDSATRRAKAFGGSVGCRRALLPYVAFVAEKPFQRLFFWHHACYGWRVEFNYD